MAQSSTLVTTTGNASSKRTAMDREATSAFEYFDGFLDNMGWPCWTYQQQQSPEISFTEQSLERDLNSLDKVVAVLDEDEKTAHTVEESDTSGDEGSGTDEEFPMDERDELRVKKENEYEGDYESDVEENVAVISRLPANFPVESSSQKILREVKSWVTTIKDDNILEDIFEKEKDDLAEAIVERDEESECDSDDDGHYSDDSFDEWADKARKERLAKVAAQWAAFGYTDEEESDDCEDEDSTLEGSIGTDSTAEECNDMLNDHSYENSDDMGMAIALENDNGEPFDEAVAVRNALANSVVAPVLKNKVEPFRRSIAEPCKGPVTGNKAEPYRRSIVEPISAPVTTELKTEPVIKSSLRPISAVTTKAEARPIQRAPVEPVTERLTEAKAEPIRRAPVEHVIEPITKAKFEPIQRALVKPVIEPITEAKFEPIQRAPVEPVTAPLNTIKLESVRRAPVEPVTAPLNTINLESVRRDPVEPVTAPLNTIKLESVRRDPVEPDAPLAELNVERVTPPPTTTVAKPVSVPITKAKATTSVVKRDEAPCSPPFDEPFDEVIASESPTMDDQSLVSEPFLQINFDTNGESVFEHFDGNAFKSSIEPAGTTPAGGSAFERFDGSVFKSVQKKKKAVADNTPVDELFSKPVTEREAAKPLKTSVAPKKKEEPPKRETRHQRLLRAAEKNRAAAATVDETPIDELYSESLVAEKKATPPLRRESRKLRMYREGKNRAARRLATKMLASSKA